MSNPFALLERPILCRPGDAIVRPRPQRVHSEPSPASMRLAERREQAMRNPISNPWGLTWVQSEVLRLMVDGLEAAQIGDALCISPKTVSTHVGRIKEVGTVMQAALVWDRHFRAHEAQAGIPAGVYELRRNGATVGSVTIAPPVPAAEGA